jgi:hypothetical protein
MKNFVERTEDSSRRMNNLVGRTEDSHRRPRYSIG